MRSSRLMPLSVLWGSAYVGCLLFVSGEPLLRDTLSATLFGQLCWLAAIGSVPTTLALGTALRGASSQRTTVVAIVSAIVLLGVAIAWSHTDFLLSGPRWAAHPQRGALRSAMAALLGLAGAAGWLWLVAGMRAVDPGRLAAWLAITAGLIALLSLSIARYRAYDYSIAQAVFPAGSLTATGIFLLVRRWRGAFVLAWVAAAGALIGAGSRMSADWVATGERELIASSRAGSLVTLYVLPHLGTEDTASGEEARCPAPTPKIASAPPGFAPDERRNVILISVDALRKDVFGAMENETEITPELVRAAADGVSFQNATTTYPATLFAIGSAFTGLSPAELYLSPSLPETVFTRARGFVDRQLVILPDVGWFRLPIVTSFLTPGAETHFAKDDARATAVLLDALRQARSDGESVMAWIHYYAPHDPDTSRPSHDFGEGRRNAYLSEVAYFDAQVGLLLRDLREGGWMEDTLVVFFSDHGEALGERRYFGHHVYLDGWMVDVPLVLWHDRLKPARPEVGVSVADIAPTVLQFLGLPQPAGTPAESLLTLDPDAANRSTFSEAFPVRGRALFDSFRLPSLDDATIRERLRSIRVANRGYEPKGAITTDRHRLIHHRSADARFAYERVPGAAERLLRGSEEREQMQSLRHELETWEDQQLERIRCRLRLSGRAPGRSRR